MKPWIDISFTNKGAKFQDQLKIEPGKHYQQLEKLLSALLEDVTTPWYSSLFFFPPLQQDLGSWNPWGSFLRRRATIDS